MTRERIIGSIGVVAFLLLVFWVATNTRWVDAKIPARPSGEAARNPFYAAERLVEELGATGEWRRALGELPEPGSVLVLAYWHWDLIDGRRARLEKWVESGGRLVLVGDLAGGEDAFEAWSGLSKTLRDIEEPEEEGTAADELPVVMGSPSGFCNALRFVVGDTRASPRRSRYRVCGVYSGRLVSTREPEWALALLEDDTVEELPEIELEDARLEAVRVRIGDGTLTWYNGVPFGSKWPFFNEHLILQDNGLFFVELLGMKRGDHVTFVSQERGEPLLALAWSHGAPAVVVALVLIALGLWRNAARFGPLAATPDPARRSLAEQIRGTARFLLAAGGGRDLHAAMLRALHEAARLRIVNYERLDAGERRAAIARLTGAAENELADAMQAGIPRGRNEFRRSIAFLDAQRGRLLAGAGDGRRSRRGHGVARPNRRTRTDLPSLTTE